MNRIPNLVIVLAEDIPEDDVAELADAIRCFRGVESVLLDMSSGIRFIHAERLPFDATVEER